MSTRDTHPSRLVLENYLGDSCGSLDEEVKAHIESCDRCQRVLEMMRSSDSAFLARHPSLESISATRTSQRKRISPVFVGIALFGFCVLVLAGYLLLLANSETENMQPGQDEPRLDAVAALQDDEQATQGSHLLVLGVDENNELYWHHPKWLDTAELVVAAPMASSGCDIGLPSTACYGNNDYVYPIAYPYPTAYSDPGIIEPVDGQEVLP